MDKPTVAMGLVGSVLDAGYDAQRWERWRPTVSLCQHEDLLIDRLELLYQQRASKLAKLVMKDIASVSPETTVVPHQIDFRDAWAFEDVYGALHDFARAYEFDRERNDYLVHITTGTHVCQICMFLLTESNFFPAKLVQTSPPPRRQQRHLPGEYRIIDLDLSKYDSIAQRFQREQREGLSFLKSGIDTRNPAFNDLIEEIEHVALASHEPMLLMGPTGAGKSQLARRIYDLKSRRSQVEGRFIEVNCATLRGDQAMSTLFGHVKGAFTGAMRDRPGLLRSADNGLLFLDEIGELGLDEQAMLLRAVEEKQFLPVGADREEASDFQLIAGTNRDLGREVAKGGFREDLLARINLWSFTLPGLADRREDIEPNIQYELDQYAARSGLNVQFNKEASSRFIQWALSSQAEWRSNFRDLNAAVTRMATLSKAGRITKKEVESEIARLEAAWTWRAESEAESTLKSILGNDRYAELDRFDRSQLSDVVDVCRASGTLSEAGRTLFATSRQRRKSTNDADRLRKYLAKFDLDWHSVKQC